MIGAVSIPAGPATPARTAQNDALNSAQRTLHAVQEVPGAAAGEAAASATRLETTQAVDAAVQCHAAARLRDGEKSETSRHEDDGKWTGPPPTFEETYLERQARTAFDTPSPQQNPAPEVNEPARKADGDSPAPADTTTGLQKPHDTSRAKAGFAEARHLSEPPDVHEVDVKG